MRVQAIWWVTCVSSALLLLSGCLDRDVGVLEPRVSRVIDDDVLADGIADVDLLLIIDDSASMREEQDLLEREIPSLVRGLTAPPDDDGDGVLDWSPVESLRVAVVTSDMGTSGVPVSGLGGCGLESSTMDPLGGDGLFRQDLGCDPSGSPIQTWQTGDDVDAFVARVGCTAQAGIRGCGFEQPLAGGAKALSRIGETGFPREDALLAVLVLTDEEDCSVRDTEAFYADICTDARCLNRYCVNNPSFLMSATQLARDLSAGRDQSRFVFAAIAGLPVDLAGQAPDVILADPRMDYVFDDSADLGLRHACIATNPDGTERSRATPGRRVVEVASLIEDALVRSICEADFRPAIADLTERIGKTLDGVCLARGLVPDADGGVDCVVKETLPEGMTCDEVPGRTPSGTDSRGRAVCDVVQVPDGLGDGWFYRSVEGCEELSFTADALPPLGAELEFQCLVEVSADVEPLGP